MRHQWQRYSAGWRKKGNSRQQAGQASHNSTTAVRSGIQLGGGKEKGSGQANSNGTATAGGEGAISKKAPTSAKENAKFAEAKEETQSSATGSDAYSLVQSDAGTGTESQPGRAEGEAAKQEAQKEAEAAKVEKSNGVKATEESERFSEEAGITLDGSGNAQNLGGNLGITKGSDGSTSVGGDNGIQVAANGAATVAGNE